MKLDNLLVENKSIRVQALENGIKIRKYLDNVKVEYDEVFLDKSDLVLLKFVIQESNF